MSVIFKGVEMPAACCFVDKEQIEYCKFYSICKKRDTIKTNHKPSDCPVKALDQEPTTKNDLEVQKAIEIIKADSLAPYSVDDILKARDLAVEALKQMKTAKNSLSVEEITAITEWTAKLTQASEEAYRRGYLDCNENVRAFQKLHDKERELKDKLNKIDIEDAWKCGFEQGVKHEKLGRTDICPHCGEYIGEEE